jgi:hypothetical protein
MTFRSAPVMAGLVPATHALLGVRLQDVGARDKPGHDSECFCQRPRLLQKSGFAATGVP